MLAAIFEWDTWVMGLGFSWFTQIDFAYFCPFRCPKVKPDANALAYYLGTIKNITFLQQILHPVYQHEAGPTNTQI